MTVNLFKKLSEVSGVALHPPVLPQENHLWHMQKVVQTAKLHSVNARAIKKNLCFVFSLSTIKDTSTLAFVSHGMARAFLLRFCLNAVLDHFCCKCGMGAVSPSHPLSRYVKCLFFILLDEVF